MASGSRGLRFSILICGSLAVAGCTTADYADGINSFSQAISQANTTEQTLTASEEKVAVANYIQHSAGQNAVVDLSECRGNPGPYKTGDCVVEVQGKSPPTAVPSSMAGITKYGALLSAVVADKTCSSLQSDATSIASSISDMAKDAQQPALSNAASPLASIVSTFGCLIITNEQLSILRASTKDANPVIQKLVPLIAQNAQDMYLTVLEDDLRQLSNATVAYNTSKSASDLAKVVSLTQAVDSAQASQPGPLISKLATLHQALADDLAAPTANLKIIENDSQAFVSEAKAVSSAIETLTELATPTTASAEKQTS
jgi:hypothetical protein